MCLFQSLKVGIVSVRIRPGSGKLDLQRIKIKHSRATTGTVLETTLLKGEKLSAHKCMVYYSIGIANVSLALCLLSLSLCINLFPPFPANFFMSSQRQASLLIWI